MVDKISTQGKIILAGMHLKISPIYLLSIVFEQYFNFFQIQHRSNFFQIVHAVPLLISDAKENEICLIQLA